MSQSATQRLYRMFLQLQEHVVRSMIPMDADPLRYVKEHDMKFIIPPSGDVYSSQVWKDGECVGSFRVRKENNRLRVDYEPRLIR